MHWLRSPRARLAAGTAALALVAAVIFTAVSVSNGRPQRTYPVIPTWAINPTIAGSGSAGADGSGQSSGSGRPEGSTHVGGNVSQTQAAQIAGAALQYINAAVAKQTAAEQLVIDAAVTNTEQWADSWCGSFLAGGKPGSGSSSSSVTPPQSPYVDLAKLGDLQPSQLGAYTPTYCRVGYSSATLLENVPWGPLRDTNGNITAPVAIEASYTTTTGTPWHLFLIEFTTTNPSGQMSATTIAYWAAQESSTAPAYIKLPLEVVFPAGTEIAWDPAKQESPTQAVTGDAAPRTPAH